MAQNLLAATAPPSLVCQYTVDTGMSMYHEAFRHGGGVMIPPQNRGRVPDTPLALRDRSRTPARQPDPRVKISNVASWVTEDQVRSDWGRCGRIRSVEFIHRPSGPFAGRVLVTYMDRASVDGALAFNNTYWQSKVVRVRQ